MDETENKDKVTKLAKKLGVEREFMKYCKDNGMEPSADSLKTFLESNGYTQSKLKEMLAAKSGDSEETGESDKEESKEMEPETAITIMIGKSGKLPPAWS